MTTVSTRFSTSDDFLFVVGAFSYDPERVRHWNNYMYTIEQAISTTVAQILKLQRADWSRLPGELARIKFVTRSEPGLAECKIDGMEVEYRYFIIQGMYNVKLTFAEVEAAPVTDTYMACYPH